MTKLAWAQRHEEAHYGWLSVRIDEWKKGLKEEEKSSRDRDEFLRLLYETRPKRIIEGIRNVRRKAESEIGQSRLSIQVTLDHLRSPETSEIFRALDSLPSDSGRQTTARLIVLVEKVLQLAPKEAGRETEAKPASRRPFSANAAKPQRSINDLETNAAHVRIEITGKTMDVASNQVIVNEKAIRVGNVPFCLLLRLVVAQYESDDGWVHKSDLAQEGIADKHEFQNVQRLRAHFRGAPGVTDPKDVIVASGDARLRLAVRPENIRVDKQALLAHPDRKVRLIAEKLTADQSSDTA